MPDPNASPSLTREQAVLIASRVVVAYLLFWFVDDLTLLPREVLSVAHYMRESASVLGANTSLPYTSYLQREYTLELLGNVLRMALWLATAGWLYRCGTTYRAKLPRQTHPPAKLHLKNHVN
jgi:hypothetical protein